MQKILAVIIMKTHLNIMILNFSKCSPHFFKLHLPLINIRQAGDLSPYFADTGDSWTSEMVLMLLRWSLKDLGLKLNVLICLSFLLPMISEPFMKEKFNGTQEERTMVKEIERKSVKGR